MLFNLIGHGISLLSVLGGGTWLYFRQERKSKELANENTAIAQWQDLFAQYKSECTEKDAKIDKLYDEIKSHRDEKIKLRNEKADLMVENTKLKLTHCEIKGCAKRIPPTGY